MTKKAKVALIGPGVVGSTLAVIASHTNKYELMIGARDKRKAEIALNSRVKNVNIMDVYEAVGSADLVLLTVSDDAILGLCNELAKAGSFREGAVVAHCSGALTSDELLSAKQLCSAHLASMHPLQTFPSIRESVKRIKGSFCYYEAETEAQRVICTFVSDIGMQPVEIKKQAKALYHASAVVACNYFSALMDSALELAEAAGIDRYTMWQSLDPLVSATLENIRNVGPEVALTGPVARGDIATISRHTEAIKSIPSNTERLSKLYAAMGEQTTQLARRKGTITQEVEAHLNTIFDANP